MLEAFDAALSVACGAFVIWLVVRILNRRERWAIELAVWLIVFVGIVAASQVLFWMTLK